MPVFENKASRTMFPKSQFFRPSKERTLEIVKIVHLSLLRKVINELDTKKTDVNDEITMYKNSLQAIAHNLALTEEIQKDFQHINHCIHVLSQVVDILDHVDTASKEHIAEVEKRLADIWPPHKDDLKDVYSTRYVYCQKQAAFYLKQLYEKEMQYLRKQLKEIVPEMNKLNAEKPGRLRKQQIYQVRVKHLTHLCDKYEKELNQKKEEFEYYLAKDNKKHLIVNKTLSFNSIQNDSSEMVINTCKPR